MNSSKHQTGYAIILIVVVIAIIASLWLSSKNEKLVSYFKFYQIEQELNELKAIKGRLLEFVALTPELYATELDGDFQPASKIPAIGYLPCPDADADGAADNTCGSSWPTGSAPTSIFGKLPQAVGPWNATVSPPISSRWMYFAERKDHYYYALDERFSLWQGSDGVPLFTDMLARISIWSFDTRFDSSAIPPVLTINGTGSYVAVIIDPGSDGLDAGTQDPTDATNFIFNQNPSMGDSDTADKVVGISYDEWLSLVSNRVCGERRRYDGTDPRFEAIAEDEVHWFNAPDAATNIGAGWLPLKLTCTNEWVN